jgi:hypothetical protein
MNAYSGLGPQVQIVGYALGVVGWMRDVVADPFESQGNGVSEKETKASESGCSVVGTLQITAVLVVYVTGANHEGDASQQREVVYQACVDGKVIDG